MNKFLNFTLITHWRPFETYFNRKTRNLNWFFDLNDYNTLISFNTSFVARTAAALFANNAFSASFNL